MARIKSQVSSLIVLFSILSLNGCQSNESPVPAPAETYLSRGVSAPSSSDDSGPDGSPSWDDLWWLERASRALRGGDSLKSGEDSKALLALGRSGVVQEFVNDPRFADTILGFNLDLLGFRQDRIRKESGDYEDVIYELPHAISSAQAILKPGGDYFHLFDLVHPIYLGPLLRPRNLQPSDAQLDAPTLRQTHFSRIQMELDQLITLAQAPTPDPLAICTSFNSHMLRWIFSGILNLPPTLPRDVMLMANWYGRMYNVCNGGSNTGFSYLTTLQNIKAQNSLFFTKLAAFEPAVYQVTGLTSLNELDLSDMRLNYVHSPYTFTLQNALPNSSTNFNRKRAAYILKRFFCDDLTPVNVEAPAIHADGAHANNPSCMACHYKLDPMAGFFRDYGSHFRDYTQGKMIYFDDGAKTARADYDKAWQPGPDTTHPWNVGYVRSTTNLTKNTYGSSLGDLYTILKTAPEVKRCLMQRMFGYLVSDDQTVDSDYLDYLTEQFTSDLTQHDSVTAVKNAAQRIVLSNSFSSRNAEASQCYDFRPGHTEKSGAPCRVASILASNCVLCHNSTDDMPYLDLTSWSLQSDGLMGFSHLDENGAPVPALKTFQEILSRISSTNPDTRMPYKSDMQATARADLYKWVNAQLQSGGAP